MNNEDPFESRLARLPQRRLPAEWRDEILAHARAAVPVPPARASRSGSLRAVLMAVLWPNPKAWAGLAAAWLLIFAFNLAAREPAQPELARLAPPSPQLRELLREQEKLLVELTGPAESAGAAEARPESAEPRSECRQNSMNA